MRLRKFMLASAALIMVLGLLVVVPVHAQVTFDDWKGVWFQGAIKEKGLISNTSGTQKATDQIPAYIFVQCWNEGPMTLDSVLIQQLMGAWEVFPYIGQVLNDNPLDYVVYSLLNPGDDPSGMTETLLVVLSIKGKEKNGELAKGQVKSVSGAIVYNLPDGSNLSSQESVKMKMIPQDKVPPDVIAACGPLCTACP